MSGLEYKIGEIAIEPENFKFEGRDPYESRHKYIVRASEGEISIYVAPKKGHENVKDYFELRAGEIVGGGSCYLDTEDKLVLNDFSGNYKSIPVKVAQELAEVIKPELEQKGISVEGIIANPYQGSINSYWKKVGF